MNKTKTFILFSQTEGRLYAQIQIVIKRSGVFGSRGRINLTDYRNKPSYILHKLKMNAKARGLGFNMLSKQHPNCQMHHINQNDVVACPDYIHNNYAHDLSELSAQKIHDNKGENSFQDEKVMGHLGNPLFIEGVLG